MGHPEDGFVRAKIKGIDLARYCTIIYHMKMSPGIMPIALVDDVI